MSASFCTIANGGLLFPSGNGPTCEVMGPGVVGVSTICGVCAPMLLLLMLILLLPLDPVSPAVVVRNTGVFEPLVPGETKFSSCDWNEIEYLLVSAGDCVFVRVPLIVSTAG